LACHGRAPLGRRLPACRRMGLRPTEGNENTGEAGTVAHALCVPRRDSSRRLWPNFSPRLQASTRVSTRHAKCVRHKALAGCFRRCPTRRGSSGAMMAVIWDAARWAKGCSRTSFGGRPCSGDCRRRIGIASAASPRFGNSTRATRSSTKATHPTSCSPWSADGSRSSRPPRAAPTSSSKSSALGIRSAPWRCTSRDPTRPQPSRWRRRPAS